MIDTMEKKSNVKVINVLFLITLLFNVISQVIPVSEMFGDSVVLVILFSQVIFAVPAIVYLIARRRPITEMIRFKPIKFSTVCLLIVFTITLSPVLTFINALSMLFSTNLISDVIYQLTSGYPYVVSLACIALLPAIMEESVYRGMFYESYSKVNIVWGALISGLLFGMMHGNFNQFTYAFAMGFVFALVVEATDSIVSSMIIHFLINGWSATMMFLLPKAYEAIKVFIETAPEEQVAMLRPALEQSLGDLTLSTQEWAEIYLNGSAAVELTLGTVLLAYGIKAVVGAILSVLLFKVIATNCGRKDIVWNAFKKENMRKNGLTEETVSFKDLVTVPLIVALIIGLAMMIIIEIILKMGIV